MKIRLSRPKSTKFDGAEVYRMVGRCHKLHQLKHWLQNTNTFLLYLETWSRVTRPIGHFGGTDVAVLLGPDYSISYLMLNIHSIKTVSSLVVCLTFDGFRYDCNDDMFKWRWIRLLIILSLLSLLACIIVLFVYFTTHVTVCVCHTEIKGYLLTYCKFIRNGASLVDHHHTETNKRQELCCSKETARCSVFLIPMTLRLLFSSGFQ